MGSPAVSFNDLPPPIAGPLRACLDAGRRFYVAALPDSPGILRHKDAVGIEEWRNRRWTYFPCHGRCRQPQIFDVTPHVPDVWRELVTRPRRYSRGPVGTARGLLDGSGLGFRWADQRLVLFDEPFAPVGVSDLSDKLTPSELLGRREYAPLDQYWTREGVRAARH